MAKQKRKETPQEQAASFRAEVKKMIAAGELSPTDAAKALDCLVTKANGAHQDPDERDDS